MNKLLTSVALMALLTTCLSGAAHAQTTSGAPVPPTDPVSQVNQRIQDQQKRIDAGVTKGNLTPEQAARDQKTDAKVAAHLSKDEAKNGGSITKAEQDRMNKKLDKNSHRIHRQMTETKTSTPVATPAPTPNPAQ